MPTLVRGHVFETQRPFARNFAEQALQNVAARAHQILITNAVILSRIEPAEQFTCEIGERPSKRSGDTKQDGVATVPNSLASFYHRPAHCPRIAHDVYKQEILSKLTPQLKGRYGMGPCGLRRVHDDGIVVSELLKQRQN